MKTLRITLLACTSMLTLAACEQSGDDGKSLTTPGDSAAQLRTRQFPDERVARGAKLYKQHCAQCHGPEAQGHPGWKVQSTEYAAAPPLNGTGRDWKLSRTEMVVTIMNGASKNGIAVMPSWKNRLSRRDVDDIMIWYQALWPAEVYKKWLEDNPDAMATSGTENRNKTGSNTGKP